MRIGLRKRGTLTSFWWGNVMEIAHMENKRICEDNIKVDLGEGDGCMGTELVQDLKEHIVWTLPVL